MKKQYRNVFAEIGIDPAQVEERLTQIRDVYFYGKEEERVYYTAGNDMAYIMDTGNNDARTEGMSYGMMLCVQLDMHEEFDRLWKWAKTYMWMQDGENEGYFAWSCACFLHRTGGETERGFSIIPMRQRRFCVPVSTKERMADPECQCGIRRIIRFYSCRGVILQIRRIICRIFMSCLRCGHMRRIENSGRRRQKRAADILRQPVIRRQVFRRSMRSLTAVRCTGNCRGQTTGMTGFTVTLTALWQTSGWIMSGLA